MKPHVTRGPRRLFFFLLFVPMFCVFPYLRSVNNPNEFVRVFTTMAIVEEHTFAIDQQVSLWGWVNDMAKVPSKVDGKSHYFMVKTPGVVYAGVPGYFVFSKVIGPLLGHHYPTAESSLEDRLWWLRASTWALRLTVSQLPCFLFLLWFEKYLRAFSSDALLRYTAVAACGLGTNYLAYTHMFASHAQYAAVAFLAFAFIERAFRTSKGDPRARKWTHALMAGFFTSGCVMLEYHALFLAIILSIFALFVFWRPTRLLSFAVGGLVNIPPVMYFHWRAYGNPLTPGHQLLETQKFAIEHKTGLWGVVWPTWEHFSALAVDPGFGFFGMSPFMWLGVLAIPLMLISPYGPPSKRRYLRVATLVWALSCLTLFLVNAGIIEWRAGWTVGPRYLAACPPFFAFGAVCATERIAQMGPRYRAVTRGVAGGLALASVLAIGTVSLLYDTLPETIERPFAQFTIPLVLTGFVPHHVGEWVGLDGTTTWYVACAAMLLAPIVASLWPTREGGKRMLVRVAAFVVALGLGMVPALVKPAGGAPLFVLHPDTRMLVDNWEPQGRDRITRLRVEAERYGPRRPCKWFKLADLERLLGRDARALADEKRAKVSRDKCPRSNDFRRYF